MAKKLSCVVCAYNEASRISSVLSAASRHPLIDELIVVDDGSSDGTRDVLGVIDGVTVISYPQNRGKAFALAQGLAAVRTEFVMLLDADLTGLGAEQLFQLAAPVLSGAAEVSVSLRSNSLALYRAIGLDFFSGERVVPMSLFSGDLAQLEKIPGWGAEALMNQLIVRQKLRLAVVRWPGVANTPKVEKLGRWRGTAEDLKMIQQAAAVLTPVGLVRQNLQLLRLTQRPAPRTERLARPAPTRPARRHRATAPAGLEKTRRRLPWMS